MTKRAKKVQRVTNLDAARIPAPVSIIEAARTVGRAPSVIYGWVKRKELELYKGKVQLSAVEKLAAAKPRRAKKAPAVTVPPPTTSAAANILRALYPMGFQPDEYEVMVVQVATVEEMLRLAKRVRR